MNTLTRCTTSGRAWKRAVSSAYSRSSLAGRRSWSTRPSSTGWSTSSFSYPLPTTPAALAERTDTAERYVREWLNAHAAAGYVVLAPDVFWRQEPACYAAYTDRFPISDVLLEGNQTVFQRL